MVSTRRQSIRVLESLADQLGESLVVPTLETLNPPLWEFGHLLWFEEFWIHRNPHRRQGLGYHAAASDHGPSRFGRHEAWFNSALLNHADRWGPSPLGLVDLIGLLNTQHQRTLELLAQDASAAAAGDWQPASGIQADYFFRLALAHELMHLEAFLLTSQTLGLSLSLDWVAESPYSEEIACGAPSAPRPPAEHIRMNADLVLSSRRVTLRPDPNRFHFDNEMGGLAEQVDAFSISTQAVSLADYSAFVADGGYRAAQFWCPEGWAWRQAVERSGPSGLRLSRNGDGSERLVQGQWLSAQAQEPVSGVSAFEAEAWCRWAGRRLPTEAEWLAAEPFVVASQTWEWTSSPFQAFEGFAPHPYKDYSAPWFGDHRVLKGHSWATHPALRDPVYRNFYRPQRGDLIAGFRTVAGPTARA